MSLTYTVLESGPYTGALPKVTGSLTWAAGSYGIVAIAAAVASGGSITASAVTGGAEAWSEKGLIAYSSRRAVAALVSDDTPANGTLSINLTHSNSFQELLYFVIQVTDTDDSGGSPFGSGDEIVQGGGTAVTSSGVGTVNANDNSFVVVGLEDGTGLQAQTDTTEIAKITTGSNTRQLFIGYSTTDGSPGAQWTGTNGAGLVAFMIQGVAGGGGSVTGSGAPASQAATVAGTAERAVPGSGTPTSQAATVAGTAERIVTGSGALTAQASTVAGAGGIQVKLELTGVYELHDETDSPVTVSGVLYEWYDEVDDTTGSPIQSGTVNIVAGEATIQLPNSALASGEYGTLILYHPSDAAIRGVYRVQVT